MRLQTLRSAAIASSLLAADLVLLTLYLNPAVEPRREATALLVSLFLPYAAAGAVLLRLLALVLASLPGRPAVARSPIEGLPWFTTLALAALMVAAALFWLNLFSYRHSIPLASLRALAACALTLTMAALVLVAVGVDTLLFPRRGRGISAPLVVFASAAAVIIPLALRPTPVPAPAPVVLTTESMHPARRVLLVGVDGLGPAQVQEGVARGVLPVFARILERGASGPLATLRPTDGESIWTTIVTGRLPRDHGVKSFSTYRLRASDTTYELLPKGTLVGFLERAGLVSRTPVTTASRKRRTLWHALNAFGIQTGVVRLWGTYPVERVKGFMVAPYFHLLRKDRARVAETLYPRDLASEAEARVVEPGDVDRGLVSQFVDLSVEVPGDTVDWQRTLVERALAPDLSYERIGALLRAAYAPPFFAEYFFGLDVVGHAFMRFAQPDRFGDVTPEEARRYGRVVERYEALASRWVGDEAQSLKPGDVLLVVSGYGMEPVPLWRRALAGLLGEPAVTGTHDGAPDGFLMAIGDGIRPRATLAGASVLDVAPTILYLMGLPVARDMEGRVLTEILDEEFKRAHQLTLIPSYESLAVTPVEPPAERELPPLPEEGS